MSVDLEPGELGFRRPLTREVSETLHIRNPNSRPIIFKVKTTAPRRYCVRPNSGRIEPGRHMDVQVLLQGMKEEPPLDAKCKDKFLVLSVIVTADHDFSNIASIWQEVERMSKSSIQERKIRVNYLPPESLVELGTDQPNGTAPYAESPPAYGSPATTKFETPATNRTVKLESSPPPPFGEEIKQEPKRSASPPYSLEDTPKAPVAAEIPQLSRDSNKPHEDLVGQLAEARAQIQKLKQQLGDNELRRRKTSGEDTKSGTSLQQQQLPPQPGEAGVPLQIAATLCLLSFLLAYFFF